MSWVHAQEEPAYEGQRSPSVPMNGQSVDIVRSEDGDQSGVRPLISRHRNLPPSPTAWLPVSLIRSQAHGVGRLGKETGSFPRKHPVLQGEVIPTPPSRTLRTSGCCSAHLVTSTARCPPSAVLSGGGGWC